jgi:predicted dehydrogenase
MHLILISNIFGLHTKKRIAMKLKWGILSTANIGTQKVIPAIQKAGNCEVAAIASRNIESAEKAAAELGIPKAYGSYTEMLDDPGIQLVYNPLPNHLHVPWTIKALEAGKHVLCEKPIGLNTREAEELLQVSRQFPKLKLMEAFMYRFHPQWGKALQLIGEGKIGRVKAIHSFFSYYNTDPANIRNIAGIGGGALMDIGCYCIQFARFIYGNEPLRVVAQTERDPEFKTDIITSGMLDFGNGQSSLFTCSTQLQPFQRAQIVGTMGRIEIEVPVNAPPDRLVKVSLFTGDKSKEMFIGPADQYTLQAEAFANAVLNNEPVPIAFDDAVNNMKVIDALFASAETQAWEEL